MLGQTLGEEGGMLGQTLGEEGGMLGQTLGEGGVILLIGGPREVLVLHTC